MEQVPAPQLPAQKLSSNRILIAVSTALFIVVLILAILVITLINRPVTNTQLNSTTSNTNTTTANTAQTNQTNPTVNNNQNSSSILWSNTGTEWRSIGSVPECLNPLTFDSPVDLSLATNILYPGQTRGGDFKAHGGFILGNSPDNNVTVTLPMEANIYQGSRYIEAGEIQILLDFITPCGIMFRFDHLAAVGSELQEFVDQLPEAKVDYSATTPFSNQKLFKAGTVVATKVGFVSTNNKSFDFGVYNLRNKNEASKDVSWASQYSNKSSQAYYGICWLDYLIDADKQVAKALPGPGTEGKTSVYCNTVQ